MRVNVRMRTYRRWGRWVIFLGMMTVAFAYSSTTVTSKPPATKIEFDAEAFTLSFQGNRVSVHDVTAVLKAEYGIVVTPHAEPGVDRQIISNSFKGLDLMLALDRLYGANRYHFDVAGGDRLRPVSGDAKPQPDEAFAKRPGLVQMPREPGTIRPTGSGNAMAVPETIKAKEELRSVEGSMPVAREIKPEQTKGVQRGTDVVPPPGRHLRIQLVCTEDGFAAEHARLAEGRLTPRRTVGGDFIVALMEEGKIIHLLSRQNPLFEHPFHHEPDARGDLAGGPIRIGHGDPCTPFTISLPASERLEKQSIQFFEYVPKPGSLAPSQLDQETFRKWLEWLEPRGSLPGEAVLRVMSDDYRPKGEPQ